MQSHVIFMRPEALPFEEIYFRRRKPCKSRSWLTGRTTGCRPGSAHGPEVAKSRPRQRFPDAGRCSECLSMVHPHSPAGAVTIPVLHTGTGTEGLRSWLTPTCPVGGNTGLRTHADQHQPLAWNHHAPSPSTRLLEL